MNQEQILTQRGALVEDLFDVIEKHRIQVGCAMATSDVIGALEWVKLEYYLAEKGNDLLDNTAYAVPEETT